MLGKRSQHLIRKFSELLVFTDVAATALLDTIGSPRSPFEMMMNSKMQSPKGLKSYEFGGVGLGIVVALDKSEESGYEVVPKHVCTSNLNRSGPIQVQTLKNEFVNEFLVGSPEDYTFVTYHEPNKTITKVYYDNGEGEVLKHGFATKNNNNVGVFRTNPSLPTQTLVQAESSYPTLDFLSSCYLCNKKLDGRDIYIYRGEKAFCSSDCRSKQIMVDERKEQCRSEASRTVELSSPPYTTRDQMFSTGIVAL